MLKGKKYKLNGKTYSVPDDRPAFHNDELLKKAAAAAAKAFEKEEESLRKLNYGSA